MPSAIASPPSGSPSSWKLQFGATAATHSWPPDGCLAAVPADLAANHAPTMALPVSMVLVALAAKLFRIRRKHRLDGRSPSLQTQSVEAAFEFLESLDHQGRQRQRARCQRRTLVEPLQFDMLRHGVDLLALGLRFATSSLVA